MGVALFNCIFRETGFYMYLIYMFFSVVGRTFLVHSFDCSICHHCRGVSGRTETH